MQSEKTGGVYVSFFSSQVGKCASVSECMHQPANSEKCLHFSEILYKPRLHSGRIWLSPASTLSIFASISGVLSGMVSLNAR